MHSMVSTSNPVFSDEPRKPLTDLNKTKHELKNKTEGIKRSHDGSAFQKVKTSYEKIAVNNLGLKTANVILDFKKPETITAPIKKTKRANNSPLFDAGFKENVGCSTENNQEYPSSKSNALLVHPEMTACLSKNKWQSKRKTERLTSRQ
ncbi:uncharacterized protein LOC117176918 isoform X2 [Belonocnema kinseyi]|uniref:uncharacterized protein LOC117176918 isoform X2 n=1 Tax=Belonocnema kinseyi TaxID=2817044 RepID=UPI00143D4338|nr:uncharacterized protein LOC117176918 isoform X2 [Belonocnema kinseyi]